MPDRSDWLRQVEAEAGHAPVRPVIHPRFADHLRLVAARLEHLQDSSEWAAYRAHLETLIEETEGQTRALEREITDGELTGDDLFRQRLRLARLRGRQDGYREALQVPEVVLGTAEKLSAGAPPSAVASVEAPSP